MTLTTKFKESHFKCNFQSSTSNFKLEFLELNRNETEKMKGLHSGDHLIPHSPYDKDWARISDKKKKVSVNMQTVVVWCGVLNLSTSTLHENKS